MSTTTISEQFTINGVLTDVTSVVLRDPTGAFGVRRLDTGATVIAAGTAFVHDGTGLYSYAFTDPAAGLIYDYWVEFVYGGSTFRFEKQKSGPGAPAGVTYLAVSDADTIANALLGLASYKAANGTDKLAALLQASQDVDLAMRYQGRRFDPAQVLEFPRVLRFRGFNCDQLFWWLSNPPLQVAGSGDEIADWDFTNNVAIVPDRVKTAVVHQADSLLAGMREERLGQIHDGMSAQSTGGASESYDADAPGASTGLCRRAWQLMEKYRLATGRVL